MRLKPKITVLGSINMDLMIRCAKLPVPGETLLAYSSSEICGGKGANQAVAAAKTGGRVSMIGRVGEDAFAKRLVANLQSEGIDCTQVQHTKDYSSGIAIVAVEESGQNSIIVIPGSNNVLSTNDVEKARSVIESSDALLLQLEVPMDTVLAAVQVAKQAGVKVILDPAPVPKNFPQELLQVDLLCPNELEAEALSGIEVKTKEDAIEAAEVLQNKGAAAVVLTMGDKGALIKDQNGRVIIPPFPVNAVDTTAAGDAFAGALAVYTEKGHSLYEAVRFDNAAGAIAASRPGAQSAMGSMNEIENLYSTMSE
jgi:ribokinase